MDTVYQDIEGELVVASRDGVTRYAKRIRLPVACHAYPMEDLEDVPKTVVESVTVEVPEQCQVHYCAGVEPLGEGGFHAYVRPDSPFALWRLASAAVNLTETLLALHNDGLPQVVIHSGRLARSDNGIVLLPTLPCVAPPLGTTLERLPPEPIWCMAPEVLRIRALTKDPLYKGDVYSLGRLILAAGRPPALDIDVFSLAERQVETVPSEKEDFGGEPLKPILELATHMCAFNPDDRPALDVVSEQLAVIAASSSPLTVFGERLTAGDLAGAQACIEGVQQSAAASGVSEARLHLMAVELNLASAEPDFPNAANRLNQAEAASSDAEEQMAVELWRGRAYSRYVAHPQHITLSASSYESAFLLASAVGDEAAAHEALTCWVDALAASGNPDAVIEATVQIPLEERPLRVVLRRMEALLQRGEPLDAWLEMTHAMRRIGYNAELYSLGQSVGRANGPLELMKWFYETKDTPGLDAARAIVWDVNGNRERAAVCLKRAQHGLQENGGSTDAGSAA